MGHIPYYILATALLVTVVGCKEKKNSEDIIATKVVMKKPDNKPIRMQGYEDAKEVKWLGKTYTVEVKRQPDDSLQVVKDERGQKFVDNHISLRIIRADGSVFFSKVFTKASFKELLDDTYRRGGILEGLVLDKVEGNNVKFAASVCLPQSDEYIPLLLSVDNFGNTSMVRDNTMDTNGSDDEDEV